MSKPLSPCLACTKPATGWRGLCRACYSRAFRDGNVDEMAAGDVAYTGGWRRDGMVWRPIGVTAADRFRDVLDERSAV